MLSIEIYHESWFFHALKESWYFLDSGLEIHLERRKFVVCNVRPRFKSFNDFLFRGPYIHFEQAMLPSLSLPRRGISLFGAEIGLILEVLMVAAFVVDAPSFHNVVRRKWQWSKNFRLVYLEKWLHTIGSDMYLPCSDFQNWQLILPWFWERWLTSQVTYTVGDKLTNDNYSVVL